MLQTNTTSYHRYQLQPPHKPPRRMRRAASFIIIAAMVALAYTHLFRPHARAIDGPNPGLRQELGTILSANPNVDVGVAVINLSKGTSATYGQATSFVAASTTKLITAADYLHQVEQGTYTLSDTLGAGTSGWQLEELVNQSDDDSWTLFNNLLGGQQISNYAHSIGLSSYDFASNTITPSDEAVLLQKLYGGKLLNQSDTKLLLSYMQHTNDDSLIPAASPAGATVYHKYGELLDTDDGNQGNYVNDAAIIVYKGQTFILTIYTNRSDMLDITTRQQIIHEITADVIRAESS